MSLFMFFFPSVVYSFKEHTYTFIYTYICVFIYVFMYVMIVFIIYIALM